MSLGASTAGARSARLVAEAKVNLVLRILAREHSGYHQLETLFQRIELGDHVAVRLRDRGRALDCRGGDLGPVERNLAWRAATAYAERAGWPRGFAIELTKVVPVGGGLGGGSADAGAVLRCFNALAPQPLAAAELLGLAGPLGSDVPFLTAETALALAWGRGERMLGLPALPRRTVNLALFSEGVATADAYRWLAESRSAALLEPRLWSPSSFESWASVADVAHNDFEDVVLPRHSLAATTLRRLRARRNELGPAGAEPSIALMSGSGASVFLLHDGDDDPWRTAPGDASAVRCLTTATATRVAAVELSD